MDNIALPLQIGTRQYFSYNSKLYVPYVYGGTSLSVQQKINQRIMTIVNDLIKRQIKEQGTNEFGEMIGTFEIKTNERNVLSLTFSNYAIIPFAAHGLTFIQSLTLNSTTGEHYTLEQLFKPGSDYVARISSIIKKQIDEREIPLLEPFTAIRPNQDYYIADKALIIYFQLYELTPYYYGFPMFPISVYELKDLIKEGTPLDALMTNN